MMYEVHTDTELVISILYQEDRIKNRENSFSWVVSWATVTGRL